MLTNFTHAKMNNALRLPGTHAMIDHFAKVNLSFFDDDAYESAIRHVKSQVALGRCSSLHE